MEHDKVADAIDFHIHLAIIVPQLDGIAVCRRHHCNEPVDGAVREMQVGPVEWLYGYCGVSDGDAVANPWMAQTSWPK